MTMMFIPAVPLIALEIQKDKDGYLAREKTVRSSRRIM
jgi:hypothetical protein